MEPENDENTGLRNIKIIIETAENIKPTFDITDISFEVKFKNELLGKSENYMSFEKEEIIVEFEVDFQYDISTEKSLDDLISNPIQFLVWQAPGHCDPAVSEADASKTLEPGTSIFSLYESNALGIKEPEIVEEVEAITETKVPDKVTIKEPKKDKSKMNETAKSHDSTRQSKGTVAKTTSEESKTSHEISDKSKQSITSTKDNEPFIWGWSNMDLELLFLGDKEFAQSLELCETVKQLCTESTSPENVPRIKVKITIDKPLFDENRKLENILYFTVESMYNLPESFPTNMNYHLSTMLPSEILGLNSACIENGNYLEELTVSSEFKRWPNIFENGLSNDTYEKLDETTDAIKNKIAVNITDIFQSPEPKIEWNIMRPCWMNEKSNDLFKKMLIRYRLWPIEIYLYPKPQVIENVANISKNETLKSKASDTSKSKLNASKSKLNASKNKLNVSKSSIQKKDGIVGEPLHLMAFADITNLLYPGVTKTRVVCQIRTFQPIEIKAQTGLEISYFISKQPAVEEILPDKVEAKSKGDAKGKDKASAKGAKGKKDGSKKSDKDKRKNEVENKIIPEKIEIIEPTPEPSQPLLNAIGEPTFIVIEMELMKPLRPKRTLEDLTNELLALIPNRVPLLKTVMTTHFAVRNFRECINKLTKEINDKYQELEESKGKKALTRDLAAIEFVRFLQEDGSYQVYMTTLLKSVAMLVSEKYKFDGETKNNKIYENFISNTYVNLVDQMNKELNGLMGCDIDTCKSKPQNIEFDYVYCAEEAVELQAPTLAERYILETLGKDTRNADVWLNLAIYYMGQGLQDQAFESLKESLALKVDHKCCLLLFAIILFDKEDYYLAETTFLSVITNYPRFVDGWICLYVFYKSRDNNEGCDVCTEMIIKCAACRVDKEEDYFYYRDGLAWTTSICPDNKKFIQTAMILIKLRALKFAELVLNCEDLVEKGPLCYYQGVVQYLSGNYEDALVYLMQAQRLHGPDFAVNSMIGHCQYRLGNFEEAKDAYEFIVYAYNRPEDMHVLYTNLSMIYEKENNLDMARKFLLIVCKLSSTPFSWLLLGAVFYKEKNMTSAEQCLNESNILDNRLPETWAYLTLVNLNNNKTWEAQQCYVEMQKHNLNNESLLTMVEDEMTLHNQKS
ncbi:hypothetical protein CBL_10867 [Carabus blaptoides fortunei]